MNRDRYKKNRETDKRPEEDASGEPIAKNDDAMKAPGASAAPADSEEAIAEGGMASAAQDDVGNGVAAPEAPAATEQPSAGQEGDPSGNAKSGGKHSHHGPAYYYGQSGSTYGSPSPYYSSASRGNSGPGYYYGGGNTYGGAGYYYGGGNSYGAGYYYGGNNQRDAEDSIFGPLSLLRVIRVILLKWPTLVVAIVLGLAAGFAYYKATPVTYKATSVVEMSVKPTKMMNTEDIVINDPNSQGSTQEIFNTRLAMLRSMKVIKLVSEKIRADYPALKTMTDEELVNILKSNVAFDIQRHSRLVSISVRYTDPNVAQIIANAYAETAIVYSMDENKETAEAGVAWLKQMQESHGRAVDEASRALLHYRQENQLDPMISEEQSLSQTYSQLQSDKLRADAKLTADDELLSILTSIQRDPTKYSSIPDNTPRAGEISAAQKELQDAVTKHDALLSKYTSKHPEVEALKRQIEVLEKQYADSVFRARETAAANRELSAHRVDVINKMLQNNFTRQQELGAKIAAIENKVKQLEFAYSNASESYQAISRRMEEARISIDDSLATIRIIELASVPKHQFSPDPRIAFSVGAVLGLIAGFLFILALDRIEDRITGSDDIKRHMNTTVLCLVPRIPRIKRMQLALLTATKKFSRIAEAFAGLRGLLESPRYANVSKVILVVSTQPEEGKTIASSNLALSFALSGKKTLLIDFDLRRPRVARIYDVADKIVGSNNLIEILNDPAETDYDNATIPSGFDNLDLVVSAVSSTISPANVIGSEKLHTFFDWARANYDHVVIDSPPFGLVSDAIRLGSFSDAVMIVCRPNKSRFGLVRHAIAALKDSGSNVIGVIVNEVNFNQANSFTSGSYNSYSNYSKYGKYGGRYGYGYGSYYKRAAKDDITTKSHSDNDSDDADSPDDRPDESRKHNAAELDVDDDE